MLNIYGYHEVKSLFRLNFSEFQQSIAHNQKNQAHTNHSINYWNRTGMITAKLIIALIIKIKICFIIR